MAEPRLHHILFYDYVPDMAERRGPHRDAHLALIRRAHEDGRLVMAGALGDAPHGGALVLRERADAEAFVADDPYVAAGLVTQWRVEPWHVVT
jgi:uncharacterized protein YciI